MTARLALLVLVLMVCCMFVQPAQAWQGRSSGMGDPAGLVEDESDFLTHPAAIAGGKGANFYGDLRFKYSDVSKFNYSERAASNTDYATSGHNWQYSGMLGTAFQVGAGRMGIFFQYSGNDGKLNGNYVSNGIGGTNYRLDSNLDSFALRLLYGVPLSNETKLGAELQLAYMTEKRQSFWSNAAGTTTVTNSNPYVFAFLTPVNLFHFGIPVDSDYYEAALKLSVETMIGPAKTSVTVRGSVPFSSSNTYDLVIGPATNAGGLHMTGDVSGYALGGDLWVRYPVGTSTALPFLVSIDYKELKRDGEGPENGAFGGNGAWFSAYDHKERSFTLTAGGGVDHALSKDSRVAGGLYYSYLTSGSDFLLRERFLTSPYTYYNQGAIPDTRENRITVKLAGETSVASGMTLNGGLKFFYGWIEQDNAYQIGNVINSSVTTKGDHWGLAASLGAVIKSGGTSIEPFITGGLDRYSIDGSGRSDFFGNITSAEYTKNIWSLGAGVSVRF